MTAPPFRIKKRRRVKLMIAVCVTLMITLDND